MGRDSLYLPKYDQMLIDHMGEGYSFESFAGLVEVSRDTVYNWARLNVSFSDAKKTAFEKSRLFWEGQGIEGLWGVDEFDEDGNKTKSKKMNATVFVFNMKNRFPKEWRDRKEIDATVTTLESLVQESQEDE